MMNSLLRNRRWLALLILLAIVIGFLAIFFLLAGRSRAAPEQPLDFSHRAMVKAGVQCLYCHQDARRSPSAGMPSVEKCMGCHKIISTESSDIRKLTAYWESNQPIPWVRVNRLPRFVYFSHEVHVSVGLNCERCHGDVANMRAAQPVVRMNMGWCLDCHQTQPNASQLRDCIICHK
jgi:c(7)-type cytochrome triheme protein